MTDDQRIRQIFDELEFRDEPPMGTTTMDDVTRGERGLRRRRLAAIGAGVVAVAAGMAFALPSGAGTTLDAGFADGGTSGDRNQSPPPPKPSPAPTNQTPMPSPTTPKPSQTPTAPSPSQTPAPNPTPPTDDELPFPATRQLLLDAAVEYFDPARDHLPAESTGFSGGHLQDIPDVGTKLSWTVPGEEGMGLVRVAITGTGYADIEEYAFEGFAADVGCETSTDAEGGPNCSGQELPGGETVWVAEADQSRGLVVSAVYERTDGSLVGVGVYNLFGNNSVVPVDGIDIDVDEAITFVTDPDLRVIPDELNTTGAEARPGR